MEDIMLIRSSFMRPQSPPAAPFTEETQQTPGVEVELKEAQVNWVDKEQKLRIHLELDAEVTKAQLNDILKKAGVL